MVFDLHYKSYLSTLASLLCVNSRLLDGQQNGLR